MDCDSEEGIELEVILDVVGCMEGDGELFAWANNVFCGADAVDEGVGGVYE